MEIVDSAAQNLQDVRERHIWIRGSRCSPSPDLSLVNGRRALTAKAESHVLRLPLLAASRASPRTCRQNPLPLEGDERHVPAYSPRAAGEAILPAPVRPADPCLQETVFPDVNVVCGGRGRCSPIASGAPLEAHDLLAVAAAEEVVAPDAPQVVGSVPTMRLPPAPPSVPPSSGLLRRRRR